MLNQRLQQKLLQKLSPQQILLMKLLQIPSVALEQRIKQEVEENPALEDGDNTEEIESEELTPEDKEAEEQDSEEFDISDYLEDEEIPAYRLKTQNTGPDDEEKSVPYASGTTFHEMLQSQLGLLSLDDHRMQLAENIIGNIDESGYLHRSLDAMVDDLAFSQNITTNKKELEEVLEIIQEFDPPGVGARDLRECLLLQLERKDDPDENVELAKQILRHHFKEFTKKHYQKILKKAGITEEQLKAAKDEILKLNPKPGNALTDTTRSNHYVIPDFIITNDDGELKLHLNSRN
ncbi:MAG: RNA polymerase sigma-54 factor, partial [Bacteroidales bacterium]|nr:RNA polymerase sigma-54 factor [Bacteroidales bacterium]